MNSLYSDQTPPKMEANIFVTFTKMMVVDNPRNPMLSVSPIFFRAPIDNLRSYTSLESLFEDLILLPENTKGYTEEKLKHHIFLDSRNHGAVLYEEFGVMAYAGSHKLDKPIASVTFFKGEPTEITRYYASPNFTELVKRV